MRLGQIGEGVAHKKSAQNRAVIGLTAQPGGRETQNPARNLGEGAAGANGIADGCEDADGALAPHRVALDRAAVAHDGDD